MTDDELAFFGMTDDKLYDELKAFFGKYNTLLDRRIAELIRRHRDKVVECESLRNMIRELREAMEDVTRD
jgi:hypothetical protein